MSFEEQIRISEFEQINEYLRNLYNNALRLAQLSMVVNPALAVAFGYVWVYLYGSRPPNTGRPLEIIVYLLGFISILGFFYNAGALAMYWGTVRTLKALLERLAVIEQAANNASRLHDVVSTANPARSRAESRRWKIVKLVISADIVTSGFFIILIAGWATVTAIIIGDRIYKFF
jgi:hypothetical protein